MTAAREWGLRSFQDKRDSDQWGGENVWDVYSLSEKTALDGSTYRSW
jgi:general secretion pathway protein G